MRKQTGFTLAELLITITVIALVAAAVFPNLLRSRLAADESAAVSSIREIDKAEAVYHAIYPDVGFSGNLPGLGPGSPDLSCRSPSPEHACLLDPKLSNATSPGRSKNGYWFLVTPTSKGVNRVVTGYVVGSAAAAFNQSGVRDFCSTEDGVLYFRVPHEQSSPVTSSSECRDQAALQ